MPHNLALIGYRGTGKSTVAVHLAARLGWQAVDADVELERRAGRSIADIFAADGEAAFRDLEATVLADLVDRDRLVLAAGGGVVLREENRRLLARFAHVAWLRATPATIHERLAADATTAARRPHLTAAGGMAEIERLLAERTPLYRQCAGLEVDTENRPADAIADEIMARLRLDKASGGPV